MRPNVEKILAEGGRQFEQRLQVAAGLQEAGPVAVADEFTAFGGQVVSRQVGLFVAKKALAIARLLEAERKAVEREAPRRTRSIEQIGTGRFQIETRRGRMDIVSHSSPP